MVIQTRFERDQKVWFRRGSQVCDGIVFSIEIAVRYEGVSVRYNVQYSEDSGVVLDESKVFATPIEVEVAADYRLKEEEREDILGLMRDGKFNDALLKYPSAKELCHREAQLWLEAYMETKEEAENGHR